MALLNCVGKIVRNFGEGRSLPGTRGDPAEPEPVEATVEALSPPSTDESGGDDLPLNKDLLDYLEAVARHPFHGVRERNAHLGVSASKGQRLKEELRTQGLIREITVSPGGRGRAFKLAEVTGEGQTLLAGIGVKGASGLGRGGVAHRWWVAEIAGYLEAQGLTPTVEDDSRRARADLTFELGDEPVAVEVETSAGHEEENIRRDLEAGYSRVFVFTESEKRVASLARSCKDERVTLGVLKDFREILGDPLRSPSSSLRPPNENEEPKQARRGRPSSPPTPRAPEESSSPFYPPGVLATPQAADYVGLSPATLETKRSRGGGPPYSKLGARVVYRREDLDAWLLGRQQKSTSDED